MHSGFCDFQPRSIWNGTDDGLLSACPSGPPRRESQCVSCRQSSDAGRQVKTPNSRAFVSVRIAVLSVLVSLIACTSAGAAPSAKVWALFEAKHREQRAQLQKTLDDLAEQCDATGQIEAAETIRSVNVNPSLSMLRSESLPTEVQPDIPLTLPTSERQWRLRLRHEREEYARELYTFSRRVLHAGFPTYSYRIIQEVAYHDPDHTKAREFLGYVRNGTSWVTPFVRKMDQQNYVWHERFGWLPKAWVDRYDQGQRMVHGKWMSADREAEIRRDFRYAWEVRTEHFLIKTNHSLERGVELARSLETYYSFFVQTFASFFNTPAQMKRLFQAAAGTGKAAGSLAGPYVVHYYRERDEYNRYLIKKIPQIGITHGLYYPSDRVTYTFDDPEVDTLGTLYHETTHQFFYESEPGNRPIAETEYFWIVEGIACYMESFRDDEGELSVGDPRHIRFVNARDRFLTEKYGARYYVPLAQFSSWGLREFQSQQQISANYSQASGLAHFFMHYQGGQYREALIEHLSQLYRTPPRSRNLNQSLPELTDVDYATLDLQYGQYLQQMQLQIDSGQPAAMLAP